MQGIKVRFENSNGELTTLEFPEVPSDTVAVHFEAYVQHDEISTAAKASLRANGEAHGLVDRTGEGSENVSKIALAG